MRPLAGCEDSTLPYSPEHLKMSLKLWRRSLRELWPPLQAQWKFTGRLAVGRLLLAGCHLSLLISERGVDTQGTTITTQQGSGESW